VLHLVGQLLIHILSLTCLLEGHVTCCRCWGVGVGVWVARHSEGSDRSENRTASIFRVTESGLHACYSNSEAGMCQSFGKVDNILASVWCRRGKKGQGLSGAFLHSYIATLLQVYS
jgi:hypothetical protein